jgi:hypothetical protein
MDFSSLLQQLDNYSEENKQYFCKKDLSGLLYFNQEQYQQEANFLENLEQDELFTVKLEEEKEEELPNNYKNLLFKVKLHIDIEKYNLSSNYYNLTDTLMKVLDYYNYNAKGIFFKKLLRDFDVYNLFRKNNYKKIMKRSDIRNALIKNNDNNKNVRQVLADYLNINLVIFTNNDIEIYCKDRKYELYRPTIAIYNFNDTYHYLSDKDTNKSIFVSDDNMNLKIAKYFFTNEIIIQSQKKKEQNIIEKLKNKKEEEKLKPKLIDFKKMKVNELRSLCVQYHIPIQEKGKNKKMKYIVKKVLIEKLKLILQ